jgi:hypothetical protein
MKTQECHAFTGVGLRNALEVCLLRHYLADAPQAWSIGRSLSRDLVLWDVSVRGVTPCCMGDLRNGD